VGEVEVLNFLEGGEQSLVATDIRAAVCKLGDRRPLPGDEPLAFGDVLSREFEPAR
jgi:hypothetical protein